MPFDKKFTHQYRIRGRGPTGNDFPEVLQIGFGGNGGIVANHNQLVLMWDRLWRTQAIGLKFLRKPGYEGRYWVTV